ncbi:DUF4261 domain-containing protein [Chryseolinea sp. T2]|uniref:DUF4261 domain-containing protein n=1 Tax=Chryseolinea sp. T2 TaxID=3129255 RepID=UPI0030783473
MFSFLKKLFNPPAKQSSGVVLGMALLNEVPVIDFKKIIDELHYTHGLSVKEQQIDEGKGISVIQFDQSQVAIALIDAPIPGNELDFPSSISYYWPQAKEVVSNHKAHIIISVSSTTETKLNLYRTFTHVASTVLTHTNAIGIYLGNQTLVMPTHFYVGFANLMSDDNLPLMNWIYIGVRAEEGKSSGYTFGLKEFGFDEIEILNSDESSTAIREMLFNLGHYVILNNVILNDGETFGIEPGQKLPIRRSKGKQLEGTIVKVIY